jgi:hypothetical protein
MADDNDTTNIDFEDEDEIGMELYGLPPVANALQCIIEVCLVSAMDDGRSEPSADDLEWARKEFAKLVDGKAFDSTVDDVFEAFVAAEVVTLQEAPFAEAEIKVIADRLSEILAPMLCYHPRRTAH